VKVVQNMLGHASAAMTLDQCVHLFGDRLDEVADGLDAARAALGNSAAAPLLPRSNVGDLSARRKRATAQ
jgi:hypothetical protein